MTADELIREVASLGVVMKADGDRLRLQPKSAIPSALLPHLRAQKTEILKRLLLQAWPPSSLRAEQRFRHPYARLLPFLMGTVLTDLGPGRLLQVFPDRAAVLLDGSPGKATWLLPEEIRPPGTTHVAWYGSYRDPN